MGRFKVDENLPQSVALKLVAAGHDACTVLDQGMGGMKDPGVAEICRHESRCIITCDLDFADIRQYLPALYAGLIVLRLTDQDLPTILATADRIVSMLGEGQPHGRLWIVEEHNVRVRG